MTTMQTDQIVRYRHVPTDDIRVGTFVRRHGPEYPHTIIVRNGMGREIAVHDDNIVTDAEGDAE